MQSDLTSQSPASSLVEETVYIIHVDAQHNEMRDQVTYMSSIDYARKISVYVFKSNICTNDPCPMILYQSVSGPYLNEISKGREWKTAVKKSYRLIFFVSHSYISPYAPFITNHIGRKQNDYFYIWI